MASSFSFSKLCRAVSMTLALVAVQGSWNSAKGDLPRPTPHELAVIEARDGSRLWYHEEEFQRDPLLRAEPHHVVVLHLEPRDRKGKTIRNTIPYRFTETAEYRFCIPKDEPHIRSLELRRERSNGVEVHVPRNAPCKTHVITAGLYQLHIEHDGDAIAAEGIKAFIHVPRSKSTPLVSTASDAPSSCYAASAITAPDGTFLTYDGTHIRSGATTVDLGLGGSGGGGWVLCSPDNDGYYTISFYNQWNLWSALPGGPTNPTADPTVKLSFAAPPTTFRLTDLGNSQFHLFANITYAPAIAVRSDHLVYWDSTQYPNYYNVPTFTNPVKYYEPGMGEPSLKQGEVALYQGCNYDLTKGVWVVSANLANFAAVQFTKGSAVTRLNDTTRSIKVGPQTSVVLYPDVNYAGQVQFVSENVPCLDNTPIGSNTASSIKFTTARDFVASTNACVNCDLTGVDLSELYLTGGKFTGTIFRSTNLLNTDFFGATLDHADFTGAGTIMEGAVFLTASLSCTNFSEIDMSNVAYSYSFTAGDGSTDNPVFGTFTCRTNFSNAHLKVEQIRAQYWRYLNLSGVKFSDMNLFQPWLTGTSCLNGNCPPPDFSGAIFNGVQWPNVNLDKANLSCTAVDGTTYCTQLKNADLNNASLRRVNLSQAILQGANFNFTNLDGANLCAAKLNQSDDQQVSASLQGAFLRNVNLSSADLTGVSLVNANLYSTASTATCNPASCGFSSSCASAVGARLGNADFTDAYVAGVDFSGSFPQSANFTGATLSGSNFTNANLTQDVTTGKRTNFTDTYLQGTNFTNATVTGANFTGAVVDLSHSSGQIIKEQLNPATHLKFPGYTSSSGSTPGCVQFTTSRETVLPQTDSSNICPSGSGPCTTAQWQAIAQPPAPVCNIDFNWIFVTY